LILTAAETFFFSLAWRSGNWFFVTFLGVILVNNVRSAYKMEKVAREQGLI
jgi:hypothetical protein